MRATKHASRGPFRLHERRHGLADIVERRAFGPAERRRESPPHLERKSMPVPKNSSRYGHYFAQQLLGFFEAF